MAEDSPLTLPFPLRVESVPEKRITGGFSWIPVRGED